MLTTNRSCRRRSAVLAVVTLVACLPLSGCAALALAGAGTYTDPRAA
ncbi:MAG: hypothetical protein LBG11_00510 [Bifidobacteriaceae bacterium]|jgi:energy-converting hydrogenase Eha subunit H|nr:hypothetical protein [Bifidobacteriaceae bacterium]